MGKKNKGNDKHTKDLLKELKHLRKGHKKLLKRVEKLEEALTIYTAPTTPAPEVPVEADSTASQSASEPVLANYPAPMKSGKYKNGYTPYRVTEVGKLTPTVMRVVAEPAGEARAESQGLVGEYVRLVTGKQGQALPEPDQAKNKARWDQPTKSTKYTVRSYNEETGALEINIVLHEAGAGATWAQAAVVGDLIHLLGPKSGYEISDDYDFYLLAGDETGLPGMARWIESMPYDARGVAFIEVPGSDSHQQIDAPENFEVVWVHSTQPRALAEVVQSYPLPQGAIFTWLAGESGSIQPLRAWVRRELGVPKGHGYSKGYWKKK